METIQASEAKTHFLRILDDVEQGKTVTVTRRGKIVARIVPIPPSDKERREQIAQAMASILEIRKRTKPLSVEEILAARDEGRRF
ncbi:MAG: type II toxin-antitoxin system prevent-host-death family antitoxin [Terracidiphilus sp.]|jgi:prevent-host-death family protein